MFILELSSSMGRIPEIEKAVESQLAINELKIYQAVLVGRLLCGMRSAWLLRCHDPAFEWISSSQLEAHPWDRALVHLKSFKCASARSCRPPPLSRQLLGQQLSFHGQVGEIASRGLLAKFGVRARFSASVGR